MNIKFSNFVPLNDRQILAFTNSGDVYLASIITTERRWRIQFVQLDTEMAEN